MNLALTFTAMKGLLIPTFRAGSFDAFLSPFASSYSRKHFTPFVNTIATIIAQFTNVPNNNESLRIYKNRWFDWTYLPNKASIL